MAIELKIKDQYNLSEHSYVFLSLIYAFILTEFVKSFKNIHYATKEIESCFLVSLTYAWLLYFLLFTLQSWWGSRLEQQKLKSFKSFIFFLIHPFFLLAFEKLIADQSSFDSLQKNIKFVLLGSCLVSNLIFSRLYFDGGLSFKNFRVYISEKKSNIKDIKNHPIVFRLIILIVLIIYLGLFLLAKGCGAENVWLVFLVIFHLPLLVSGFIALKIRVKQVDQEFARIRERQLTEEMLEKFIPRAIRNKRPMGLLLVDKRNIPKSVISEILKIIRIDDVYIQNEDMFCCLFISNESFDKFSLDILLERANAEKFEKGVAFLYKDNIPQSHIEYEKEFLKLFKKCAKKLKNAD